MRETPRTDVVTVKILSSLQSGTEEVVYADFARQLERENAALREAMRSAIDEISWFVGRQKNLMGDNGEGRPWSAVLDEDLNILRNALANKVAE